MFTLTNKDNFKALGYALTGLLALATSAPLLEEAFEILHERGGKINDY